MTDRIYRVRAASQGWTGGPGLNTFYFRDDAGTGAPSGAAALLCVNRVRTAMFDGRTMYPNGWSCQVAGQVDVLEATTGELVAELNVAVPAVVTGTLTDGWGAIPTMMLLRLKTDIINDGRRISGRAFLGPVGRVLDTDGSPQTAAAGTANAVGVALLDTGATVVYPVVWRRPRLAVEGPPEVTARAGMSARITSTNVPDKFAVLRSRRD